MSSLKQAIVKTQLPKIKHELYALREIRRHIDREKLNAEQIFDYLVERSCALVDMQEGLEQFEKGLDSYEKNDD